jgi:hypothetical protein
LWAALATGFRGAALTVAASEQTATRQQESRTAIRRRGDGVVRTGMRSRARLARRSKQVGDRRHAAEPASSGLDPRDDSQKLGRSGDESSTKPRCYAHRTAPHGRDAGRIAPYGVNRRCSVEELSTTPWPEAGASMNTRGDNHETPVPVVGSMDQLTAAWSGLVRKTAASEGERHASCSCVRWGDNAQCGRGQAASLAKLKGA